MVRSAAKLGARRSSENVELKIEANMFLVFWAICAQPMLDERIALIWSDPVNLRNLWGCFCCCRCFLCFSRTERAAVGADLSDD